MTDLGRVLVLAGGLSHERDVSLRSGRRVAEALRDVGVDVFERDADSELLSTFDTDRPAVVFPLLHGAQGEDGAIQEVLALTGLPYVGSPPASCRQTFDKPMARGLLERAGLNTAPAAVLPQSTFRELGATPLLEAIVTRLGLPLVVKPARGGSALGTSVVRKEEDLPSAMVECFAYGHVALVEQMIDGIEIAVSVIDTGDGPDALPAVEIVAESGTYDYHARYTAGTTEFFVPARLTPELTEQIKRSAITAHRTLGLRDLSRTDMIVDSAGTPWLLDVNVAPGMTETSLLPQSVRAAGIGLGDLARDLLGVALSRAA
ncbi:D-alanine--D-alanine ligase [Actinobacteria bacterium YIM 96077]|uniref:D-alanine--D-alanine ligase n=1 Tax=Phytoactinopolyspora halophila TaxID=1981511 RepID=A0A329QQU3_9ACTN|nr:D-alanine--D-alanine ligase [Phytoactinopolyspora halophila]AYY15106.1 D-alanine--D-alanine ligase [Actinobacteria bacterium YIM 96077]RAW14714.1 D-alanine--D-alanine ligase [Phytoactinopolyspora halophila]